MRFIELVYNSIDNIHGSYLEELLLELNKYNHQYLNKKQNTVVVILTFQKKMSSQNLVNK